MVVASPALLASSTKSVRTTAVPTTVPTTVERARAVVGDNYENETFNVVICRVRTNHTRGIYLG